MRSVLNLETFHIQWYYNNAKGKHPLQSGCSEFRLMIVLTDTAYPVGRQDRRFYYRLFLLSRKASKFSFWHHYSTLFTNRKKIIG